MRYDTLHRLVSIVYVVDCAVYSSLVVQDDDVQDPHAPDIQLENDTELG